MMKKILILFIIFIPITGLAQNIITKKNRLSIGISFSPNYSFRTLKSNEDLKDILEIRNEIEHASLGLNTGIILSYLLKKSTELQLGFQFAKQTYAVKKLPYLQLTPTGDSIVGSAKIEYQFNYLELPLRVNQFIIHKKISAYIFAGSSFNFFLSDIIKARIIYNNGSTDKISNDTNFQNFNKVTIAALAGFGIQYEISNRLKIRFEPIFRHSLTPIADVPIRQFNYSIGAQFGAKLGL